MNKDELGFEQLDHRGAILSIIRDTAAQAQMREALEKYHDNDIAGVLEELSREERARLLRAVGYEAMSSIVSYLDDAGEYLSELDADAAADIIEQMDADDALEALEDLDSETRQEVLSHIEDAEVKEEIALLDSYEEDEFGSYMSTNFIAIPRTASVKSAMRAGLGILFGVRDDVIGHLDQLVNFLDRKLLNINETSHFLLLWLMPLRRLLPDSS